MRRRQVLSLLGGAALAPLAPLPVCADPHQLCGVRAARDDGWPIASGKEDDGIDRDALCRMADRLAASGANIHAVLVARGGTLVFERYFKGADERPGRIFGSRVETVAFDAGILHSTKSVSKSVASLAVGIAIDRGLIAGVDEPIFSFFPELSDLRSPEKDLIRLSHVLGMSMGLAWVEATPATGDYANDEARMRMAWDPCRHVLSRPVTTPAGHAFFYNTGALALVAAIVRKATGRPLDEFARETLLEPLGIAGADWGSVRGETDAGGGLRLRPRDMAKIGQLVLAGGRWNGRQIVSKAWVETSTAPKLEATDGQSYAFLWWLGRSPLNGRENRWIGALGRGGQSIRIVPELDLVVAVTAGYYQDYSPRAFQVQYGVFRDVLRAAVPAR
jgi:CubicO group peptidase (beta-lactamase class C family)